MTPEVLRSVDEIAETLKRQITDPVKTDERRRKPWQRFLIMAEMR
jgi:hypothetical protein